MKLRNSIKPLLSAVVAAVALAPVHAAEYATVSSSLKPASVKAGGTATLTIKIALAGPKYHINANKPADAYAFPTAFTPTAVPGVAFGAVSYPKAAKITESYSTAPLLVYKGAPTITVPLKVAPGTKAGAISVGGTLKFQGCDDKACYPPQTKQISASLTVK